MSKRHRSKKIARLLRFATVAVVGAAASRVTIATAAEEAVVVASTTKGRVVALSPSGSTSTPNGVRVGGPGALAVNTAASLVYVAPEWGSRNGQLIVLARSGSNLREVSSLALGGTGSVHIAVSPDRKVLVVSHYSTGSVSVVQLDAAGKPQSTKSIPLPLAGSQPHGALFVGDRVLVTDVAHDDINILRVSGTPRFDGAISMRPGDRPRSLASLGGGRVAVTNQRSNSVSCLRLEGDRWAEAGRVQLDDPQRTAGTSSTAVPSAPTVPLNGSSPVGASGIPGDVLALSGGEVAVVNRGPDEVVRVFATKQCALTIRDRFPSGAIRPRGLAIQNDSLYVSHELGALSRFESGRLVEVLLPNEKVWSVASTR